jgi:hypothetical protein
MDQRMTKEWQLTMEDQREVVVVVVVARQKRHKKEGAADRKRAER